MHETKHYAQIKQLQLYTVIGPPLKYRCADVDVECVKCGEILWRLCANVMGRVRAGLGSGIGLVLGLASTSILHLQLLHPHIHIMPVASSKQLTAPVSYKITTLMFKSKTVTLVFRCTALLQKVCLSAVWVENDVDDDNSNDDDKDSDDCDNMFLVTVKSRIQYARFSPKIEVRQPGCV